jgi:hypothetical protein
MAQIAEQTNGGRWRAAAAAAATAAIDAGGAHGQNRMDV